MEDLITATEITQSKLSQEAMTSQSAKQLLEEGNSRFLNKTTMNRDLLGQVKITASGQFPFATIVSCIDSRIPTEIVFDQGVGDIFNARIAGNFMNEDILGSLEFACKLAGSKLIVVMGHTSCGAVKGACDNAQLGNLTQMLGKIKPAVDAVSTEEGEARDSSNLKFVNEVAEVNVHNAITDIRNNSSVLKEMADSGEIEIVGAMYDVKTGEVSFL